MVSYFSSHNTVLNLKVRDLPYLACVFCHVTAKSLFNKQTIALIPQKKRTLAKINQIHNLTTTTKQIKYNQQQIEKNSCSYITKTIHQL